MNEQRILQFRSEMNPTGRDGKPSQCVCLFTDQDAKRNVSLAAADGLDKAQLKCFVGRFLNGGKPLTAVSLEACSSELNLRAEVVETLIMLLEKRGAVQCVGKGPDQVRFRPRKQQEKPHFYKSLIAESRDEGDGWRIASLCAASCRSGIGVHDAQRELFILRDRGFFDLQLSKPCKPLI